LPDEVAGVTVNRFCSSGLQAIANACERVMTDQADCLIAGGVESMSLIPMGGWLWYPDPGLVGTRPGCYEPMGLTAENVAQRWKISREDQDAFGYQSQMRACKAVEDGKFKDQILPLEIKKQVFNKETGKYEFKTFVFDTDEGIRPSTTLEGLGKLRPAFSPTGSVTAGNSSQTSDGAAVVMVTSK
jgi:acetyl-CoA acyltransferase